MTRSLLSAFIGWLACVAGFTIHFRITVGPSSLPGAPFTAALSGVVIFFVWLCLLWPLYRFVPFPSPLWHPVLCTLCGAIAGVTILLLFFAGISDEGLSPHLLPHLLGLPFLYVGFLVGAVTCAAGSILKRFDRPPA